MTFNQTTVIEYKTNAGTVGTSTVTETGETQASLDTTIAHGGTNILASVSVDVSQVLSFLIFSTLDMTVKTNSPTSPDQSFNLAAGHGFTWNSSHTDPNPLTVDITAFYFTNNGTADATVELRFLFV